MKKTLKIVLLLIPISAMALSGCKKCQSCNYTNSQGNKGPTFEVCGDEIENLKSQKDADSYSCVEAS